MTINLIGHEFTINQVGFTTRTDCFVNIQKKKENILFKSSSNEENINLSFIQSETVNSSTNLSINDRSVSLSANRAFTEIQDQILESVGGFSIETDLFLVTDIFTTDLFTQRRVPLFFKHTLSHELDVDESYNDVRVLDVDFNNIINSLYVIDDGIIYSNLQNTFDPITGLYDLFFVTYSVRKANGVLERYTEILNNHPVYHLAELDDIDFGSSSIIEGHKAYLLEEDISGVFSIILPTVGDYGIRRTETSRLQLIPPDPTGPENPWFVSIRNGQFLSEGATGIKKFYIAEYGSQSFIPSIPYKQTDETSYRVSNRIIKTIQNQIAFSSSEFLYPEVVVYKSDGSVKFALTADPAKVGTSFNSDINYSYAQLGNSKVSGVQRNHATDPINSSSIDTYQGFIVLPAGYEIAETDTIRTIYTYTEPNFLVSLFDFNPLSSSDLVNKRIVFLVRPQPLGSTLTQTLYYLLVNEDGLVIDHNIDFSLAGLPSGMVTSGVWYDRDPDTVSWAQAGSRDFVEWCTVEGTNNQDDIFILGDVYLRNAIHPQQLVLNDIRVRGGGVREELIKTSIAINPEVEWYWDIGIWDGKPYPGAASIFVEVPIDITTTSSGVLTAENITEITKRHIAHGEYPVIHGYTEYQPTISGLDYVSSGYYTVIWSEGPTDSVYDVYMDTISGLVLLAEGLTNNEFTASGINEVSLLVVGRPSGEDVAYLGGPIFEIEALQ